MLPMRVTEFTAPRVVSFGITPEMVAEVGFEPTMTFWVILAYETRELNRATLLRD